MTEPNKPRSSRQTILLGLVIVRRNKKGRAVLRPNWARIAVAGVAALAILWTVKTVALYYLYRENRNYEEVSLFQTFLYPLNRAEMTATFGNWQIEKGKEALQERDFRAAYLYLKQGVARSPANKEGRLTLAALEQAMRDTPRALTTLGKGVDYHNDDPEYLKPYLMLLLQNRHDQQVLDTAEEILPDDASASSPAQQLVAYAAARVEAMHGNYQAAERYLQDYDLMRSENGIALHGTILWQKGRKDEAISYLTQFAAVNPAATDVSTTLVGYLLTQDRKREAVLTALSHATASPDSFAARLLLIRSYAEADRQEGLEREVGSYLRDFGEDQQAILALSDWAADAGRTVEADRIYREAVENGFNMGAFGLLYIETYISARQYARAEDFCKYLADTGPKWVDNYPAQFNFLRACAAWGMGNTELAQLCMNRVVEERLTGRELLSMAARLRSLDLDEQARQMFQRVIDVDPRNELAMAGLVELDLRQRADENLVSHVDALLDLRRPDYDLLDRAEKRLRSDRFIFEPERPEVLADIRDALAEQDVAQ